MLTLLSPSRAMFRASMGPRLISRGNGLYPPLRHPQETASMGPRLISRGNVRMEDAGELDPGASMGPRLISRGNVRDVGNGIEEWRFNGAATDQSRKCLRYH